VRGRGGAWMAEYATARVYMWDRFVGVIAESDTGEIIFEYDRVFRGSGLEISPLQLPLERDGPMQFPELRKSSAFLGLPGVFADALPDAFGNAIIRRYFEEKGRASAALSPVQRLLYVGGRALGALEFRPVIERNPGTEEVLDVCVLVDQARRVIEGDTSTAIPEIMQVGSTVGGARAKALILWNRETDVVRSGYAKAGRGEEPWIIKFDGVNRESGGQEMHADRRPGPWGRIEYVYARMARDAGIAMSDTHLMIDGELGHFMTRRFDRVAAAGGDFARIHMHSLGGALHLDHNDQYTFSYEGYFDTIRALGLGQDAVNEAFRRMVFSVATINFDDHLKNFSFLMNPDGTWRLSPAYDVAYAENNAWTRQHQMSINGKFSGITRHDVTTVAQRYDAPADGRMIIDAVSASLDAWPRYSAEAGVPEQFRTYLEGRFERF